MVNAAAAAGFADLFAGIMALEIFFFLEPQSTGAGTAPSAQAPLLDSAVELWLPLAAAGTLLTAVAFIYHHLSRRHAAVPAAGAANRRLSGVVISILCVSAGVLQYFFFVQPAGDVDLGARARELDLGALRALPPAATATFFWGMMLIIIAHVRAGCESGGGAIAGAGNVAIQGTVRLLTRIAVGAAAGLVFLVTAFCIKCRCRRCGSRRTLASLSFPPLAASGALAGLAAYSSARTAVPLAYGELRVGFLIAYGDYGFMGPRLRVLDDVSPIEILNFQVLKPSWKKRCQLATAKIHRGDILGLPSTEQNLTASP